MSASDGEFTPRKIEAFAAVMTHGATTKAADVLNITQPAVRKMLVHPPNKAGFTLFSQPSAKIDPNA